MMGRVGSTGEKVGVSMRRGSRTTAGLSDEIEKLVGPRKGRRADRRADGRADDPLAN